MNDINNQDHPFVNLFIKEFEKRSDLLTQVEKNREEIKKIKTLVYVAVAFASGAGALSIGDFLKLIFKI